jgi:hypothetical protein
VPGHLRSAAGDDRPRAARGQGRRPVSAARLGRDRAAGPEWRDPGRPGRLRRAGALRRRRGGGRAARPALGAGWLPGELSRHHRRRQPALASGLHPHLPGARHSPARPPHPGRDAAAAVDDARRQGGGARAPGGGRQLGGVGDREPDRRCRRGGGRKLLPDQRRRRGRPSPHLGGRARVGGGGEAQPRPQGGTRPALRTRGPAAGAQLHRLPGERALPAGRRGRGDRAGRAR